MPQDFAASVTRDVKSNIEVFQYAEDSSFPDDWEYEFNPFCRDDNFAFWMSDIRKAIMVFDMQSGAGRCVCDKHYDYCYKLICYRLFKAPSHADLHLTYRDAATFKIESQIVVDDVGYIIADVKHINGNRNVLFLSIQFNFDDSKYSLLAPQLLDETLEWRIQSGWLFAYDYARRSYLFYALAESIDFTRSKRFTISDDVYYLIHRPPYFFDEKLFLVSLRCKWHFLAAYRAVFEEL